jgi:hypothetical protein
MYLISEVLKMKKSSSYILFSLCILFISLGNIEAAGSCVTCGADSLAIPEVIPNFVSRLITLAQIMIPIILIVSGMVKYMKVVASGDDKTAKETNNSFIRSIITGVAVFLIVAIVKFAFGLLGTQGNSALSCVSCFIDGSNCIQTACLERGETNFDTNKHCSEFTYSECPSYDYYNNECEKIASTQTCQAAVIKKDCSDYLGTNCPTISENGDYCKVENVTAGASICTVDDTKKHCGEYSYNDCPSTDDYGAECYQQIDGAMRLCTKKEG